MFFVSFYHEFMVRFSITNETCMHLLLDRQFLVVRTVIPRIAKALTLLSLTFKV